MLSSPDWKLTLSDQPPSILAVPNHQVSLQCPTTKYPCKAQPKSIPAVPNRRVSLQCPTAEYQYSCSAFAVLQGRLLGGGGAGKRYTSCAIAALGWGCSKEIIDTLFIRRSEHVEPLLDFKMYSLLDFHIGAICYRACILIMGLCDSRFHAFGTR